ncbi:MAG TPA: acyltransferase family protein [Dehalococcoidia bacterium]|nr:acyltransferase family protein [Dehalococcoidia bacterium]
MDARLPRFVLHSSPRRWFAGVWPQARLSRREQRKQASRRRFLEALQSSRYLPGLDGLRALAVLAVLLYHARPEWLPGGFLGVEVFFTISGFIITRSLLQEWQEAGRIDLRGFWLRRARRLLPALFLLLVAVLAYTSAFEPNRLADLRGDVVGALGYFTNWDLILAGQSYFESFERPSALRHLWSLAVEEQFYVIWPMLLCVCLPILKRNMTLVLILIAAVASAVAMAFLYEPGKDASRVYYGTDTRASGLLLGAALAFVLSRRDAAGVPRRLAAIAGTCALVGLGVVAFLLDETAPLLYRGGFFAVGLLSCAASLAVSRPGLLSRVVGCGPLRWLGVRSYGVYLWHWPVFLLAWPDEAGFLLLCAQVTAVILIAAISYQLFEKPVRQGALSRVWDDLHDWRALSFRRQSVFAVSGSVALALIAALALVATVAKAPETPAYMAVESVRIRSTEIASSQEASIVPSASFTNRIRTSFAELASLPLPCPTGAESTACSESPPLLVSVNRTPEDAPMGDAVLADLGQLPEESATAQLPQAPAPAPAPIKMPEARIVPAGLPMVTAIGDSVMMGAANRLATLIPNLDLDSQVGRQAWNVVALLRERQQAGQLGQIVLVHVGNNGTLTRGEFEEIMSILGSQRQVIFLNLQVPRAWQDSNNAVLAAGVAGHANAQLIDWHAVTMDHPELFATDQVHLSGAGAELYTRLVIEAVLG